MHAFETLPTNHLSLDIGNKAKIRQCLSISENTKMCFQTKQSLWYG